MFAIDKQRDRAAERGYGKTMKIKVPDFNEKWPIIVYLRKIIYDFIIFLILVSQENITCVI